MLRLVIAFAVMCLHLHLAGAQDKSDREKANLIGPVRSVRSKTVDYKDETLKVSLGTKELNTVTYDEKGNQVEHIIDEFYGMRRSKDVRKYDSKGMLIESVLSEAEGVLTRQVFTYENGKLMRIVSYEGDGKVEITEDNSYGKDGRLLETKYTTRQGPFGKTVYKHDEKGNLAEVAFYHSSGARSIAIAGPCVGYHRITYTYDEQRNPTKLVYYEPDGSVKQTWQYSYDAKGLVTTYVLQYYDVKQTFVYVYEFDSHGNWIKKTSTKDLDARDAPKDSKITSVTSREISYY